MGTLTRLSEVLASRRHSRRDVEVTEIQKTLHQLERRVATLGRDPEDDPPPAGSRQRPPRTIAGSVARIYPFVIPPRKERGYAMAALAA